MRLLDLFCGEGGAGAGYARAGFDVFGVDNSAARLARYPFDCLKADALAFAAEHAQDFDAVHASPPCTGYTRGTVAVPDRLARYDRLIAATRDVLEASGRPYVIENVSGARSELKAPILLCGRQFGLEATDDDGTRLVLDRHRLLESSIFLVMPYHAPHKRSLQVAGAYSGGRRDKLEARHVRRGGYAPSSDVQRALLRMPWASDVGVRLAIPPVYAAYVGDQLAAYLAAT